MVNQPEKNNTDTEAVDGPAIAARLMARLSPSVREKVINALNQKSPDLAIKVANNVLAVEDLPDLTAQSMHQLLRSISQDDLLSVLASTKSEIRESVLTLIPAQRRAALSEELSEIQTTPERIKEARSRLLKKMEELASQGLIQRVERGSRIA